MHYDDFYAIFQLIVWAGMVTMLGLAFRPLPPSVQKQRRQLADACLGLLLVVGLFEGTLLSADKPIRFTMSLVFLGVMLWISSFYRGRFRLSAIGSVLASVAILLALLFNPVQQAGYCSSRRRNFSRIMARNAFQEYAEYAKYQPDTTVYPEGVLDDAHPFCQAHPELIGKFKPAEIFQSCWHTCFTGISRREKLPPPVFHAGTMEDNLPQLREYYGLASDEE
ncbi:MAG: hypothetical protein IKO40_06840 [Kiritimatiellae bacterium]|nr:hypothetical protein [Kiritimatiellia bacterium]